MAAKPVPQQDLQATLDAVAKYPTQHEAAAALGISRGALEHRLKLAIPLGLKAQVTEKIKRNLYESRSTSRADAQAALDATARFGGEKKRAAAKSLGISERAIVGRLDAAEKYHLSPTVLTDTSEIDIERVKATVLGILKQQPHTVAQLAIRLKITEGLAHELCKSLYEAGHNVFRNSENYYSVEKAPPPNVARDDRHVYESTDEGQYKFGVVSDTHLCSKYYRADVLNKLYEWFASQGVTRVYHAGNWIDGEARFNKHDLVVHGMDAQLRYLAEHYPTYPGVATYSVAGDDHEGWYNQREGVDIGRYAETKMEDAGRTDWVNLGYMEAFVELRHKPSGKSSQMLVMHPGGGSAYAISYTSQKIVESLTGGEKPAVLLVGHYHKMELLNIRNTWVLQCGCTKDQDPFMRKKRIEAHIGGTIMELHQDHTGAIMDCLVWMKRFFNTGYYNDRFSLSGPVVLPAMRQ